MNEHEARTLIRQVLAEQEQQLERVEEAAVNRALRTTLVALGIIVSPDASADNLHEQLERFQKNTRHVDKWRKSVEQIERVGWGTVITVLVAGTMGIVWMALKAALGKG